MSENAWWNDKNGELRVGESVWAVWLEDGLENHVCEWTRYARASGKTIDEVMDGIGFRHGADRERAIEGNAMQMTFVRRLALCWNACRGLSDEEALAMRELWDMAKASRARQGGDDD